MSSSNNSNTSEDEADAKSSNITKSIPATPGTRPDDKADARKLAIRRRLARLRKAGK